MGRNSGGIGNGGGGKSSVKKLTGATESGYTPKMVKNIVGLEQKYRQNRDETLHVFNQKGDIIVSFGGKGARVSSNGAKVPANSILTHNHPRALQEKGIGRIGNSFSVDDIRTAVNLNAREIRAVTPTYAFSLKRPSKGWGLSPDKVKTAFAKAEKEVKKQHYGYLNKVGYSDSAVERASITHFHKVMKILSKEYGWKYSKKNS